MRGGEIGGGELQVEAYKYNTSTIINYILLQHFRFLHYHHSFIIYH